MSKDNVSSTISLLVNSLIGFGFGLNTTGAITTGFDFPVKATIGLRMVVGTVIVVRFRKGLAEVAIGRTIGVVTGTLMIGTIDDAAAGVKAAAGVVVDMVGTKIGV